jgi:hypothetical protein
MSNYYLWIYGPGIFGHIAGGVALMMLCFYFLPTIIAIVRKKYNIGAILVLNFFLGWTFIGWIVALIWAVSSEPRPQQVIINNHLPVDHSRPSEQRVTPVMIRPTGPPRQQQPASTTASTGSAQQEKINQLQQLKELLDNGVLTQEEFIRQKSKILDS